MNRIHILRKTNNPEAEQLIAHQAKNGDQVTVILIQDAVLLNDAVLIDNAFPGVSVRALREDAKERDIRHHQALIDYQEMARAVMEADSLVCW